MSTASSLSRLHPLILLLSGISIGLAWNFSIRVGKKSTEEEDPIQFLVQKDENEIINSVEGLIGNTKLVRINSLSNLLGLEILGKCEFLNPFGSVKDRVSLQIIIEAEQAGILIPHIGCTIFEGTSGSTGISIAGICRARGYKAYIVLPDDVSKEKVQLLEALGATVEKVRPVSIVSPGHYVNIARQRSVEFNLAQQSTIQQHKAQGFFHDQFERESNTTAHYLGTGLEIWNQTNEVIDAFISGSGTGGTIAGVGRRLKENKRKIGKDILIVLADPEGSGLYHRVMDGVMYSSKEEEGKRRRFQVDTVVEGIGLNRLTANFEKGLEFIDTAYRIMDAEAIAMSRHLAIQDGLFLGSSAAVNLVAAVKLVKEKNWGNSGKTIVTILCDSGTRHYSRFWNDNYLKDLEIPISSSIADILAGNIVGIP